MQVLLTGGTAFIGSYIAIELAQLYTRVLHAEVKTYFGLSKRFVSWEAIAREAIGRSGSKSQLVVEDRGWSEEGALWDVSDMQRDFGLEFDPWEKIQQHLDYTLDLVRKSAKGE
jgi:hypothetical protein